MPIYIDTVPQNVQEIKVVTLQELVTALPNTILYPINVWAANKIARYGQTSGDVLFLTDEEIPSIEVKEYLNSLVAPLGIKANVYNTFRASQYIAMRIYDNGELIIDKATGAYKRLPAPIPEPARLTIDHVRNVIPRVIPYTQIIYLTGSIAKNGWSNNDIDFITLDEMLWEDTEALRQLLSKAIGWPTHVGTKVMSEREPVFMYKIYEGGKCLLPLT